MSLKIWREFYTMSHCPQYKEEFTIAGCDSSARKGESRRRGWEQVYFFKPQLFCLHLTLDSCMCSWHDWVISLYKDLLMFSVKLKNNIPVVLTMKQAELGRRPTASCRGRSQRKSTRRKRNNFRVERKVEKSRKLLWWGFWAFQRFRIWITAGRSG